jgi:cephalosporin-C deacetylase-like acetyl esterase
MMDGMICRPLTARVLSALLCVALYAPVYAQEQAPTSRPVAVAPDRATGVYAAGETLSFTITPPVYPPGADGPARLTYRLLKNGATPVLSGPLEPGQTAITVAATQPATYLLEVTANPPAGAPSTRPTKASAGAVVDPERIKPAFGAPDDFDSFWASKLAELAAVAPNPQVQAVDVGTDQPEYYKVTLDNIRGTKVYGQLARPRSADAGAKFPAVLVVQWAGVYPLERDWVLSRAREGWLAMNIIAHDVPFDLSKDEFKKLNETTLKDYIFQGNTDREQSYFLRMYLATARAAEYLASRPDWNGEVMLVTGGSQGGQQAIVAAALSPHITHVMANVPAGANPRGREAGQLVGFPYYFGLDDPQYADKARASQYFDIIHFAPRVKVPTLVGIGLIDTTCPAPGLLAMVNQLAGAKESVLMPLADHGKDHAPYYQRVGKWMDSIRSGGSLPPP